EHGQLLPRRARGRPNVQVQTIFVLVAELGGCALHTVVTEGGRLEWLRPFIRLLGRQKAQLVDGGLGVRDAQEAPHFTVYIAAFDVAAPDCNAGRVVRIDGVVRRRAVRDSVIIITVV